MNRRKPPPPSNFPSIPPSPGAEPYDDGHPPIPLIQPHKTTPAAAVEKPDPTEVPRAEPLSPASPRIGETTVVRQKPSRFAKRLKLRSHFEIIAGLSLLAGIAFLFIPKSWVKRDEKPGPTETVEEPAPPVEVITTPPPKTAAEWIATARIGGVRPDRIIINGKVHKLGEPIPPFGVRWVGKESGKLLFRDADGSGHERPYAQ